MPGPLILPAIGAASSMGGLFGSLGSAGGFLSGAGQLLGGLGGLFGGGEDKGPSLQEQSQLARIHENRSFDDRIRNLEKHGINKMLAVGMNPASPGMQFSFGGSGSSQDKGAALDAMGQGISRAASAFDTNAERHLKRLTLQSAAADVEGKLLENQRLRSELRLMNSPGTPPPVGRTIWLQDRDGSMVEVTNPDAGDNEWLMLHDYMTRTLPQDLRNMARRDKQTFRKRTKGALFGGWLDPSFRK